MQQFFLGGRDGEINKQKFFFYEQLKKPLSIIKQYANIAQTCRLYTKQVSWATARSVVTQLCVSAYF